MNTEMRKKRNVFGKAVFLSSIAAFGGWLLSRKIRRNNQHSASISKKLRYDRKSLGGGFKKTYARPLHWQKKEMMAALLIFSGVAVLFSFDEEFSRWFRKQEKYIPQPVKDFGWYYGSPEINYPLNLALYLFGIMTENESFRRTGIRLLTAASAAGLVQTISKKTIGRARPYKEEGKASFQPFTNRQDYYSFPSGHSILSFTTGYAISKESQDPILKLAIMTVASIAPASRLWAGAHWLTDVYLSLALSLSAVESVDSYLNNERNYLEE
ncbi:MAG: phosphatase PAP2 family protein [Salegentibacter sp.]